MAAKLWILKDNLHRNSRKYPDRRSIIDGNMQNMTNTALIKEFRMNWKEIEEICKLVQDKMQPIGHRSTDLSLENKVLLCLKTLGSGSFQSCSKDFLGVSQPTVSKQLSLFTNVMAANASKYIYMPRNREEIAKCKKDFYQLAGFPGIVGCVDGSHTPIVAPREDEFVYVNRKRFHSINIQAVCDANLIFQDVVARWPGSHHDSFIMDMSTLSSRFENDEFGESWMLGDSGYSLKKWLMTPYPKPIIAAERKLNFLHRKTRRVIEQSFGVLKSRFRILDHTGGILCYAPEKVAKITITCCMLYNICRRNGTPILDSDGPIPPSVAMDEDSMELPDTVTGLDQRRKIAEMIC